MNDVDTVSPGRFCWLDLAATDAVSATRFYHRLFGWTAREQWANGGHFTRLQSSGQEVGSLYQLRRDLLGRGAQSHWTPYVRVLDVGETARRASEMGGAVIVRPFDVSGIARIAIIVDAVGAQVGLWESLWRGSAATAHA
jgi:predicted enzyme related to lactoylglutathione lyase